MAIEGIGESLLGEKRARDTKRRKKEQTYDTLGAAATIGVSLYRESLRKKQDCPEYVMFRCEKWS